MLHVALHQPTIAPNTGNIARQCIGMGAALHLIGPLGFSIDDAAVKRAGLDYWPHLNLTVHDGPDAFLAWLGDRQPWLVTRFGRVRFDEAAYADGDVLLLGSEVSGLPEDYHRRWPARRVFIPMSPLIRSYNLSNAAALVLGVAAAKAGVLPAGGGD